MTRYVVEAEGFEPETVEGETLVDAIAKFTEATSTAVVQIVATGSTHITVRVSGPTPVLVTAREEEEPAAISRRLRGFTQADFEVTSDGRTVWVNNSEGTNVARFGTLGVDIHHTLAKQSELGVQCLYCTHARPSPEDWQTFRAKLMELHGVHMPDFYRPSWVAVDKRLFAQTAY